MKKYLPYIAVIVITILVTTWIVRAFMSKPKSEHKELLKKLDEIQKVHYDSIRAIVNERQQISRDCTIIINNHEKVRNNLSDPVGDSLARAIIKEAIRQGFD